MIKLSPQRWSLVIALAVILWMASGVFTPHEPEPTAAEPMSTGGPVRVLVRESVAGPVTRKLRLTGYTSPAREATLAAETAGRIVSVEALRGDRVQAGDVIARIDERWRREKLAEAQALVRQREIEYEGAIELAQKGFRAESQKAESLAALERARTELRAVELDLEATVVRAPFDGVLHERPVEVGDFVDVGNPVAEVVETDPFIVVADVAEGDVARLQPGQFGEVVLIDGRRLGGELRYLAPKADPQTRTFRIEMAFDNPDGLVVTGMSADLELPTESLIAHRLSPSALSLDGDGNPGIKLVDDQGQVVFHRVALEDVSGEELLVGGLDPVITVITAGQGFVRPGDRVDAIPERVVAEAAATRADPQ